MKTILSVLLLTLSTKAFALQHQLVALTCTGANGLQLSVRSDSNNVRTEWGTLVKDFETNRVVSIYNQKDFSLTRVVLGLKGKPNVYAYDIYLSKTPVRGQKTTLKGVIGKTVNTIVFPKLGSAVPVPVGFVTSTSLNCVILTK